MHTINIIDGSNDSKVPTIESIFAKIRLYSYKLQIEQEFLVALEKIANLSGKEVYAAKGIQECRDKILLLETAIDLYSNMAKQENCDLDESSEEGMLENDFNELQLSIKKSNELQGKYVKGPISLSIFKLSQSNSVDDFPSTCNLKLRTDYQIEYSSLNLNENISQQTIVLGEEGRYLREIEVIIYVNYQCVVLLLYFLGC